MGLREQEIAKRREKARNERYRLTCRATAAERWEYLVGGTSGQTYTVVVLRHSADGQSCSCPDFAKTGLGTCKHVEAVRLDLGLPEADPIGGPEWQEPDPVYAAREFSLPPGVVCFDIETLRLFDEVGGRRNLARLGLAVAVTYDSSTDSYETWLEPGAAGLIEKLRAARLVVGYNIVGFDYPVLQAYTTHPLHRLPTLDIMYEIAPKLPFRPGLAAVGSFTLGYGKSGDGRQAVRWFRQGQVEQVVAYCRDDVRLVRNLLGFGLEHGHLRCFDGQRPCRVVVDWPRRFLPPA